MTPNVAEKTIESVIPHLLSLQRQESQSVTITPIVVTKTVVTICDHDTCCCYKDNRISDHDMLQIQQCKVMIMTPTVALLLQIQVILTPTPATNMSNSANCNFSVNGIVTNCKCNATPIIILLLQIQQ